MSAQEFVCTPERPWTENDGTPATHPRAVVLFEEEGSLASGGSYERIECPDCGVGWWKMLPD